MKRSLMVSYVYIPNNLFRRSWWSRSSDENLTSQRLILGHKYEGSFVVIDIIKDTTELRKVIQQSSVQVVGSVNMSSGSVDESLLYLRIHPRSRRPYVEHHLYNETRIFSIVFFSPPNLRNLEYFTTHPIMLQTTGQVSQTSTYSDTLDSMNTVPAAKQRDLISDEVFLDLINKCHKTRSELRKRLSRQMRNSHSEVSGIESHYDPIAFSRKMITCGLTSLGGLMLWFLTTIISYLNKSYFGMVPVQTSCWFRQLDLRLRQITFFPIQFLSYYDPNFLTVEVQELLKLPVANKRYNINNSNYINLYNTMWLMINDVLLGHAMYKFIVKDLDRLVCHFNQTLRFLIFEKIESFIYWIGLSHPAGFKLNNDLGHFLETLFLWTSQNWGHVFNVIIDFSESETWLKKAIGIFLFMSCSCGFTFIAAGLMDYIRLSNLHLYVFYTASTKIYHEQLSMLKSLVQLFQGKKYNVLRNRVDSIDESELRIDQTLLGTLSFMMLVYLAPTTLAFYLLFLLCRVVLLTVLKMGDKAILCFNIYPLFVVLLKLKNSRRLQGGVTFLRDGCYDRTDWLVMKNKALTWEEIHADFFKVFKREGRLARFVLNLVEGKKLQMKDNQFMKFHYLMLPGNYAALANVWNLKNRKSSG